MSAKKRKPHTREGLALVEAAAISRHLHAEESTCLVRRLNALLHRALCEYAARRDIDPSQVGEDIDAKVAEMRAREDG
jgi:hypothetical protein